jgi:hypothetical protein
LFSIVPFSLDFFKEAVIILLHSSFFMALEKYQ